MNVRSYAFFPPWEQRSSKIYDKNELTKQWILVQNLSSVLYPPTILLQMLISAILLWSCYLYKKQKQQMNK